MPLLSQAVSGQRRSQTVLELCGFLPGTVQAFTMEKSDWTLKGKLHLQIDLQISKFMQVLNMLIWRIDGWQALGDRGRLSENSF